MPFHKGAQCPKSRSWFLQALGLLASTKPSCARLSLADCIIHFMADFVLLHALVDLEIMSRPRPCSAGRAELGDGLNSGFFGAGRDRVAIAIARRAISATVLHSRTPCASWMVPCLPRLAPWPACTICTTTDARIKIWRNSPMTTRSSRHARRHPLRSRLRCIHMLSSHQILHAKVQ